MTKDQIRKKMKEKRNSISKTQLEQLSSLIYNKLISTPIIDNYNDFFIYNSFSTEVSTKEIIKYLLKNNKNVYLPKVVDNNIIAIKYNNDAFTKKGSFSIEEPFGNESLIDNFICIVPLLAVDKKGNRIGFGKGYYDRYLKDKKCLKIGICYNFQVIDNIPNESHDIKLDIIITDKEIITPNTLFSKNNLNGRPS